MSVSPCAAPDCDRPARDANVCNTCAAKLEIALSDVPALTDELETTLTRQARIGDPSGGNRRGGETLVPFHPRASEVGWTLWQTLVAWVRELHTEPEGYPHDSPSIMSRWLLTRAERIRQHQAGGEAVDELTTAVDQVWRVIDRPAQRWYAGACSCGEHLYATPGARSFTCRGCGADYDVAQRQEWLRAAAEDQLAHAALISQALTTLALPVTPQRIRKWAERGQLVAHSVDTHGRALYRVGEVIELLARSAREEKPAC